MVELESVRQLLRAGHIIQLHICPVVRSMREWGEVVLDTVGRGSLRLESGQGATGRHVCRHRDFTVRVIRSSSQEESHVQRTQ